MLAAALAAGRAIHAEQVLSEILDNEKHNIP
jgi:hypothetical protein